MPGVAQAVTETEDTNIAKTYTLYVNFGASPFTSSTTFSHLSSFTPSFGTTKTTEVGRFVFAAPPNSDFERT